MAKATGVSAATVQRVWSARGLKPHRVETFKLSNDKRFEEKLVDVVGLYMNPPEKAIVLCMDEKSQIQALDRTQPSLPMKRGRAGTMTHDYKRNGTTTLFAALDVLSGKVIGQCLPQHTNNEFLQFLKKLDREVPKGLAVHVITRQLRYPRARQRAGLAGQAPPLPSPLHAHFELLAQHGGDLPASSPKKQYAAGYSAGSQTWSTRSSRTLPPTTTTPSRSRGPPPPTRSSRRSAAAESPSKQSPTKTGTGH